MSRISQSFSFGDLSYRRREQVTDSYFSFPWALQEAVKKGERIPLRIITIGFLLMILRK